MRKSLILFILCCSLIFSGTTNGQPENPDKSIISQNASHATGDANTASISSKIYEAELGILNGSVVVRDAAFASSGKVVTDFSVLNSSVQAVNVDGGAGGSAPLKIRYSNGNAVAGQLTLYVSGIAVERINFPPTGGWNSFAEITKTINLTLGKGNDSINSIMLQRADYSPEAADKGGVDIDKLTVFTVDQVIIENYELVWSDEFNGTGAPDATKWGNEIGYIRNNELQYYTKSLDNLRQYEGNLEVTVRKQTMNGYNYTSGSIVTAGKGSWAYGKIEGRFKMPVGKGLWACFWTLGSNITTVGWPKCGEIDIFEHINNENFIHGTAHWADTSNKHVAKGGSSPVIDVTEWHIYSIEWTSGSIKWLVDGNIYYEFNIANGAGSTQEFHMPHYILINLPIGGSWPGAPDETTVLPATMYCDYVRVYKWIPTETISVSSIQISPSTITAYQNKKVPLSISIIPSNADNTTVNWKSSDNSIATVNATGVVTAVGPGTATITATSVDGGKTSTCSITVLEVNGVNFVLNPGFELDQGEVQKAQSWNEWTPNSPTTNDFAKIIKGTAHTGEYYGSMASDVKYAVMNFQTINNLPIGTYTLKGWFRSSGGQGYSMMSVKNYGGTELVALTNSAMSDWTQLTIKDIKITNGQCEIDIYNDASGGQWIDYDDIELTLNAPTSGMEATESINISVYPTLVTNHELHVSNPDQENIEVTILSMGGQTLYKNKLHSNLSTINTSFLSSGMYIVCISCGAEKMANKIIVP